jgi:hypothetical protein
MMQVSEGSIPALRARRDHPKLKRQGNRKIETSRLRWLYRTLRCSRFKLHELLKFEQDFLLVHAQIAHYFSVAQQLADVATRNNQVQVIRPIGLLGNSKLSIQIGGFTLHKGNLLAR